MIEKTVSLINQSTGKKINIDELPQNDVKPLILLEEEILKVFFSLNLLV
jgi:DNA polymerase-3 subunit alpha